MLFVSGLQANVAARRAKAERSIALGPRRTEERRARLDALLGGANTESHARDLAAEVRIVARLARWRAAEHASIEGLALLSNGGEGDIVAWL
ncbi:MAG: hypothetical protein ABSE69_09555 [Roseiarcus sp.]